MSQSNSSSSLSASGLSSVDTLRTVYANKQVGECFEFGCYPQGANGEIEPITWRVLQRNTDYLLVIAERGLDGKPYNEKLCEITWADCSLRRWLNSEFYNMAFNEQERKCILQSSIDNNACSDTEDCVFLLSIDEAKSLFANDNECRAEPTEFAVKNGTRMVDNGCCVWWLRSRGRSRDRAAYVRTDGDIVSFGGEVKIDVFAVRPAFRIALVAQPSLYKPATAPASAVPSLRTIYADKQVGERFEFGRYPQGANCEIEPITWRVLRRKADHLLVIAEQCLDCNSYDDEFRKVTWAGCTLRRWLNLDFYYIAFNEQERKCILQTNIVNNTGPNTKDRVFLLSFREADILFANDNARRAKPTEYVIKNEVYTFKNYCCWWLRSRGCRDDVAAYVLTFGDLLVDGISVRNCLITVRPALKLVL